MGENGELFKAEAPRCRYCLPFSFNCPECLNHCTDEKAEKTKWSTCSFLGHQPDCPFYKPDPNYPTLVRFGELEKRAKELKSKFEDTGQREILEELIRTTKEILKLLKESSFTGFTGRGIAYLHYRSQLMELEKQLPMHRRIMIKLLS